MAKVLSETEKESTVIDLQLLKDEENSYGFMYEQAIATITFFKGGDFKASVDAIRSQFLQVVTANPWLAGRLVTTKEGVRLRYPAKPSESDFDALFTANDDDTLNLSPKTPYPKMTTAMYASKKVIVQRGQDSLDKDIPVALLTLSRSRPESDLAAGVGSNNSFALVWSLSHVVGDGRTYYDLFKMLQPRALVKSLTIKRIYSFSEDMRDLMGRKTFTDQETVGFGMLYTFSTMCMQPAKCAAFYLDDNRIESMKKEVKTAEPDVSFVSTNDIITSAFFKTCKTRLGWMGFDCRGRMDGIGNDLGGNYVSALTLDDGSFKTPGTIRKLLNSPPYTTSTRPFPSFCSWLCGKESAYFGMVTNWSSFAEGLIEIDGCELEIHIPIMNTEEMMWDVMIPFTAQKGRKGVICWVVHSDEDALRQALPVGDLVSKDMFC